MPTLEIVNHRLNIFKKKIERVDYLEILARETGKDKKQTDRDAKKSDTQSQSQNQSQQDLKETEEKDKMKEKELQKAKDTKEASSANDLDQTSTDVNFYSFKKRMQQVVKSKREREEEIKKQLGVNTQKRQNLLKDKKGLQEALKYKDRANFLYKGQLIVAKQQTKQHQQASQ